MFKKARFLILMAVLLLLLSSCSSNNDNVPSEQVQQDVSSDNTSLPETKEEIIAEPSPEVLDESSTEVLEEPSPEEQEEKSHEISFNRLNIPWEATDAMGEGFIGFLDPQTELWGYCDYDGNVVADPKFRNISGFTDGYADVTYDNNSYSIDKKGNLLERIEQKFDLYHILGTDFESVSNDLIFDRSKKYGYYPAGVNDEPETVIKDANLNIVAKISDIFKIFPDFTGIGISDNYISVTWYSSHGDILEVTTALIDYNLNVIIEPDKYAYIVEIDKDHLWVANLDCTFGLINKDGKHLIEMSENPIYLLLDYKDKNKTRSEGSFPYNNKGGNLYSNSQLLHNYQVVNYSGENYILILERGEYSVASAQIYDLDKEKIVGVIPSFSIASSAPLIYLLPDTVLHTDPLQCYDFNGNLINQTVFPEEGYYVETASIVDDSTVVVNLEGDYLRGDYSGMGFRKHIYIKVSTSSN